jgi:hypothetical protein
MGVSLRKDANLPNRGISVGRYVLGEQTVTTAFEDFDLVVETLHKTAIGTLDKEIGDLLPLIAPENLFKSVSGPGN